MSGQKKLKQDYSFGLIPFYWEDGEPRYFLGRIASGDEFWKFPKGHKDGGESDLQAAIRETAEEIGIEVDESKVITEQSFKEVYVYESRTGGVEKTNTYWLVEMDSDEEVELSDEFSEYCWVSLEEALDLLPKNSQKFLKEAHSTLIL